MSSLEYQPPYKITLPKSKKVAILLSIPHSGIRFPNDIKRNYKASMISKPDDTDWSLQELYDFASKMGITVIEAVYSRWVIDLNRTPVNQNLYHDGRIITALCPSTDFFGTPIYTHPETEPSKNEIQRRLKEYYIPYHEKIDHLLIELRKEFGQVLFWDAHSIRRNVKTIQKDDFPDLILGNNDESTASKKLIETALKSLQLSDFNVQHNHPFKGGYLTRSKGNPSKGIHALQLEMCKDLYMQNKETVYDPNKAVKIKTILEQTFTQLISCLHE
jgi:N-formylglutamate amidohydrolase